MISRSHCGKGFTQKKQFLHFELFPCWGPDMSPAAGSAGKKYQLPACLELCRPRLSKSDRNDSSGLRTMACQQSF